MFLLTGSGRSDRTLRVGAAGRDASPEVEQCTAVQQREHGGGRWPGSPRQRGWGRHGRGQLPCQAEHALRRLPVQPQGYDRLQEVRCVLSRRLYRPSVTCMRHVPHPITHSERRISICDSKIPDRFQDWESENWIGQISRSPEPMRLFCWQLYFRADGETF